ncbi:ADP-dependent glucokinase-like [Ornithodoros turicata]|uniref:ADP-dependent glucokinase-like n=1 Tax=Ornithodoros turicata TaxID=34597 RepID=UPI003138F770
MTSKWTVSISTLVSALVIFYAYYYKQDSDEVLHERLQQILDGLLKAERKASVDPKTRIAIGFGSCQDLIVQSSDVLAGREPTSEPRHVDVVQNEDDLMSVFAYYFRHGAAAERFVSNATLFDDLTRVAASAESAEYFIGGNAPLMARRFALEGCEVLLGAHMSDKLRSQLPPGVSVTGPITSRDEVHMLLEYPAGQEWGPYVSPRANRFIIHNDHKNPTLSSVDSFGPELEKFEADLLVVGGLQMMDNFPFQEGQREARIREVQEVMKSTSVPVHFEMASYTDTSLLHELVEHILPYSNSLGMNEQELPNLYNILKYGNVSYVSDSYPRVATVLDTMRDVYSLLQKTDGTNGRRSLERLHVHTLAFQAILVAHNSPWKNSMASAAKAALTAHRHTCGSHEIDTKHARVIMDDSFTTSRGSGAKRIPFDNAHPVACWQEELYEICVAPVLVCTKVLHTGGGGDNVSAAGLVLQV